MKKLLLIILFELTACSRGGVDNLKGYIEYGTKSDSFIRWTKDQQITWDFFKGEPKGNGLYSCYFGLYYFYDVRDSLKINATLYIDKEKSWFKPKTEWGKSSDLYESSLKVLKLKFDFYEYVFRQLRRHLIENQKQLTDDQIIKILPDEYYNKAESEWRQIEQRLDFDYSNSTLSKVRVFIDKKLNELSAYDTRVNSRILNSD